MCLRRHNSRVFRTSESANVSTTGNEIQLDFDPEILLANYHTERDKRLRAGGVLRSAMLPSVVICGAADDLFPDSVALAQAMETEGVEHELHVMEEMPHAGEDFCWRPIFCDSTAAEEAEGRVRLPWSQTNIPPRRLPSIGPAGSCAQKVTVLNLGDNNSQSDFRLYAVFSFIFRSLSVAIRKTFVFFTVTKREGSASKTCEKTRLKINVRKSGGLASF